MSDSLDAPSHRGQSMPGADETILAPLLFQSFKNTLRFLQEAKPEKRSSLISRPNPDDTWSSYYMEAPNLRSNSIWNAFSQAWKSGVATQVVDYFASTTLSSLIPKQEDSSDRRSAWVHHVAHENIAVPLWSVLEDFVITCLVDGKEPIVRDVPDVWLKEMASYVARASCFGIRKVEVLFAHLGLDLDHMETVSLPDDVTLRRWTARDKCLVMSKFRDHFLWQEATSYIFGDVAVKANFEAPLKQDDRNIAAAVLRRIDRFRLALTLLDPKNWKKGEGIVLILVSSRTGQRRVIRLVRLDHLDQWSPYRLDDQSVERLRRMLSEIGVAAEKLRELEGAVERFGRACSADLAPDKLLEAVVGLESLLVSGASEASYRFSINAATLLAGDNENVQELFPRYREMYNARSGLAHGEQRDLDYELLSGKAIVSLARAVGIISTLHGEGKLREEKSVAKSVEQLVLSKIQKIS